MPTTEEKVYKGRVKLYFSKKGFGFIQATENISGVREGQDIFFHRSNTSQHIRTGSAVLFKLAEECEDEKLKIKSFSLEHSGDDPRKWPDGVQVSEGKQVGKVKWFNPRKGYGFIEPNVGGKEIFVHQSNIVKTGFRSLRDGEEVEFNLTSDAMSMIAANVSGPNGSDVQGSLRP